jgi:O-antigen ligase
MRIAIIIILCLISIPLTLKRPNLGLALYIGINIIRPEMLFWSETTGNFIFKILYIMVFSAALLKGYLSRSYLLINRQTILMLLMVIGVILSEVFSLYVGDIGGKYAIELAKNIGFCMLVVLIVDSIDDIVLLQKIMLGCFTFMGIWGIFQRIQGNERVEGLGGGAWPDSNVIAAVFVLVLPVAFAQFITAENKNKRFVALGMFITIFVLIVCTQSRAGTLGAVTGILMFGYFAQKMRQTITISAIAAVLIVSFAGESYIERMKTMQSMEQADTSALSRITLWQTAAMVFANNPFFGTGFMTFPIAKMEYKSRFQNQNEAFIQEVFRIENMKVTHNTYLQMLSDCGLFGGAPFIALILSAILIGVSSRKLHNVSSENMPAVYWLNGISAGICGFAVCILTLDMVTDFLIYLQITLAFLFKQYLETQEGAVSKQKIVSVQT